MRRNPVREKWAKGEAASNLWIDIGWPVTVEALGRLGYDSYTVDMQHSLIDRSVIVSLFQALSLGGGAPMVRVTQNDPGEVAFVLDAGAYGVICPTIETAAQAKAFVAACEYPPKGERSWGPTRGVLYGGADYFDRYRDEILTIALIETAKGVANLDEIAAVPGLDMVYLGPNDLGVSHGARPSYTPNHPEVDKAMDLVPAVAKKHGVAAGMHTASKDVALAAKAKGYTFLSLAYASKVMMGSLAAVLEDAFPGDTR